MLNNSKGTTIFDSSALFVVLFTVGLNEGEGFVDGIKDYYYIQWDRMSELVMCSLIGTKARLLSGDSRELLFEMHLVVRMVGTLVINAHKK